jgi:4-amino-4-deoxy-L-arabinose transferase-like glycosyltransferase
MIIGLLTPTIFYVAIFAIVYKILRYTYPVFESLCLAFFISQLNFLVSYSRNYNFAIITTFFVLSAFYLIVFTKLSSWKQNMLLGAILGFILLSRTVSIIYIPFLIGLLIFTQITEKRKLLEMLRNYLIMAGTFLVVTYAWLNKNYHLKNF